MFESTPPEKKEPLNNRKFTVLALKKLLSCTCGAKVEKKISFFFFSLQNLKVAVILAYGEHLKSICFRDTSNAEKDL